MGNGTIGCSSRGVSEFPDVIIKLECEEEPWVQNPQSFPITDSEIGFPGIIIKVEEEEEEETWLPDFQGCEENVAVPAFHSGNGPVKEEDCFPSESTQKGLGTVEGRLFQYPRKADLPENETRAERLHRNHLEKTVTKTLPSLGGDVNETRLQKATHKFGRLLQKGGETYKRLDGEKMSGWRYHLLARGRNHKREKLHTCLTCGKKFLRRAYLIRHKINHTGKKPYTCSVCGKSFGQRTHLISHNRTHTGEKTIFMLHLWQKNEP
ncbi:hypothetical protein JRQ81_012320 [Phrynocephalus forsythii]|uniref:C2H2-type domain-containing protein n=1 Tax=Phrynocephalus forsythii TaxID=171643 RepID=A0A9Q0X8U9_9SAUR|nr:hypothetical protein JRQ81_012320 [Phrynocephalus forsythii]